MKTKAQLQKTIEELFQELSSLDKSVRELEQASEQVDVSKDTQAAVRNLTDIQNQLFSKKQVRLVVRAQLDKEQSNLHEVIKAEREQKVKELRVVERAQLVDVLNVLQTLVELNSVLEGTQAEIRSNGGMPDMNLHLKNVMDTVKPGMRNMRSVTPELFGLPAKPSRQEQLLNSARSGVESQKNQLKALKAKRDVPYSNIQAAEERLQAAQAQLETIQAGA